MSKNEAYFTLKRYKKLGKHIGFSLPAASKISLIGYRGNVYILELKIAYFISSHPFDYINYLGEKNKIHTYHLCNILKSWPPLCEFTVTETDEICLPDIIVNLIDYTDYDYH